MLSSLEKQCLEEAGVFLIVLLALQIEIYFTRSRQVEMTARRS